MHDMRQIDNELNHTFGEACAVDSAEQISRQYRSSLMMQMTNHLNVSCMINIMYCAVLSGGRNLLYSLRDRPHGNRAIADNMVANFTY